MEPLCHPLHFDPRKHGADAITRDLDNLRIAGLAERDDATGHWRLTPRLPQQAIKVFNSIDAAQRRVDEARNRLTRNPY